MDENVDQPDERDSRRRSPPQRLEEINLGDELIVLMRRGRNDSVIGRLTDGRVILPSKESTMKIDPGDTMIGDVAHVTGTYIIITPKKVLGDTTEALILNLQNVADSGHYQHCILAKALLFLVEKNMKK